MAQRFCCYHSPSPELRPGPRNCVAIGISTATQKLCCVLGAARDPRDRCLLLLASRCHSRTSSSDARPSSSSLQGLVGQQLPKTLIHPSGSETKAGHFVPGNSGYKDRTFFHSFGQRVFSKKDMTNSCFSITQPIS